MSTHFTHVHTHTHTHTSLVCEAHTCSPWLCSASAWMVLCAWAWPTAEAAISLRCCCCCCCWSLAAAGHRPRDAQICGRHRCGSTAVACSAADHAARISGRGGNIMGTGRITGGGHVGMGHQLRRHRTAWLTWPRGRGQPHSSAVLLAVQER